jgi:hypothetical protein
LGFGEGGILTSLACLATTYSPTGVVPSAQERFTVEFGMGSSGGVPLLSPGKRRMLSRKPEDRSLKSEQLRMSAGCIPAFRFSDQNDLDLFVNALEA